MKDTSLFSTNKMHASTTCVFIVLSPRYISVQFAPSSGGCSQLHHLKLNRRLVHESLQLIVGWVQ